MLHRRSLTSGKAMVYLNLGDDIKSSQTKILTRHWQNTHWLSSAIAKGVVETLGCDRKAQSPTLSALKSVPDEAAYAIILDGRFLSGSPDPSKSNLTDL